MSDPRNCHHCQKPLTWMDLKNFIAKVGNLGLSFYGGYLCEHCLEKARDKPTEPRDDR